MQAHLTWLDVAILLWVSFGLIGGLKKGFFRQLAGIIGMLAGFYCGLMFWYTVANFLGRMSASWEESPWLGIIAFFICLSGSVFLFRLLGVLLEKACGITISVINKWLGGVFGTARAVLEIIVLFAMIGIFKPVIAIEVVADSIIAIYFAALSLDFISFVWPFIPEAAQKLIFGS